MSPTRYVLATLLAIVTLAGAASAAWSITGNGVLIKNGDMTIDWQAGSTTFTSSLSFGASGEPILDGVTLDFRAPNGPITWKLTKFSFQSIHITGSPATDSTMRIVGLEGTCSVTGVLGGSVLSFTGSNGLTWTVPAGQQTINVDCGAAQPAPAPNPDTTPAPVTIPDVTTKPKTNTTGKAGVPLPTAFDGRMIVIAAIGLVMAAHGDARTRQLLPRPLRTVKFPRSVRGGLLVFGLLLLGYGLVQLFGL